MVKGYNSITANTAETQVLNPPVKALQLFNDGAAKMYVTFNWKDGDTEVSASAFNAVVPAGGSVLIDESVTGVGINNMRIITTATGVISYVGY